jgi:ArsR family transcriptional regulator
MATTTLPLVERERGVCCVPKKVPRADRVEAAADVLKALADPTRLAMALILRDAEEPVCICDLVGAFDLSQPTVSHHMARLREAGLVESEKQGIWAFYRLRRDLPTATRRIIDAIG